MNQHWPCVAGRNVTSVSTNVTSIEDHPGSNEQFIFQVQLRKNSFIQWIVCVHQVHHSSL